MKWPVLFALAILLPLLPLFPAHGIFLGDWVYHLWPVGFIGEFLKVHHEMPLLVNSKEMVFLPAQIFYGHVLYPFLGFLSLWIGPDAALKISVLLIFTLQFFLVLQFFYALTKNRQFSFFIACLIQWAVYPLTNLYNRSAIPELFATLGLSSCLFCCLLMIFKEGKKEKIFFGTLGGWCLAFSFGSHPITALFGSFFLLGAGLSLIPIVLKMKPQDKKLIILLVGFSLLLTCFLNLPWIYLNHLMLRKIFISTQGLGLFFYGDNIDSWTARFSVYPRDLRVVGSQLANVPNPYLDAQINMPLLIFVILFFGLFLFKGFKKKNLLAQMLTQRTIFVFAVGLILFLFSTWMSLSPRIYDHLPLFTQIIQFAYRMITYQNLALVLILISLILSAPDFFKFETNRFFKLSVITGCLVLALGGAVIKNAHAFAVRVANPPAENVFLTMPAGYNTSSYISTDIPMIPLQTHDFARSVNFEIGTGEKFGQPLAQDFDVEKAQWIKTNVAAFSWNSIMNNGQKLSASQLFNFERFLSFWAEPGHYHLETSFDPNPQWLFLRRISLPLSGALSLIPLIAFFI